MSPHELRQKSEEVLARAMATPNAVERGRLLGLAAKWRSMALSAPEPEPRSFRSREEAGEGD